MNFNELLENYKKKRVNIGIVGIGYVGLKLLIQFANAKFNVIGFDQDYTKIKILKKGRSPISYIKNSEIKKNKRFISFKNTLNEIRKCHAIILCLPTPLKRQNPDLSHILETIKNIKKYLQKYQMLILESTTYPGTTEEKIKPLLDKKFEIGKNFFIGYSPERENPGDKKYKFKSIPKVCAGYSKKCKILCSYLYSAIVNKVVLAKTIKEAEFTKLIENIYRSVNISMVNEMKMISHKMGIDIDNVLNLANSKPFGFKKFEPGPGIGGHCIPIDPYYLHWKAKKLGIDAKFIKLAGITNENTTKWIAQNLIKIIKKEKFTPKKTKLLILGLAYKKNIEDTRESSSTKIINKLKNKLKKIDISEPFLFNNLIKTSDDSNSKFMKKNNIKNIKLNKKNIQKYDIILIITDHDIFDYKLIKKYSKVLIDTRNRVVRKNRFYKL